MHIGQQALFGNGENRLGFGPGGVQVQLGVDPIIENVRALYRQAIRCGAVVIITEIGFDDGQQSRAGAAIAQQGLRRHDHHRRAGAFGGGVGHSAISGTGVEDVAVTRAGSTQAFPGHLRALLSIIRARGGLALGLPS